MRIDMSIKHALLTATTIYGCAGPAVQSVTQQLCTSTGDGGGGCCPGSPIVLDLAGDGVHLTSAQDGVLFTLRPGRLGLWAWTEPGSDDAFLALDVDENGRIDDGSELFGDESAQAPNSSPNGFAALAYYDSPERGGDGDGAISPRDAIWPRLRLWRDADHDAYSAADELTTLDYAGVHSISLAAEPSDDRDGHGNEFRFRSTVVADAPISDTISDAWLAQAPIPRSSEPGSPRTSTTWVCWSWAYATVVPIGSYQPEPCDNAPTANDRLVTAADGQLARMLGRFATDTDKSAAMSRSASTVTRALQYDPTGPSGTWCDGWRFPTPDSYYPPPYDDDGSRSPSIRTKCFSQTSGGGGGGGECAAGPP